MARNTTMKGKVLPGADVPLTDREPENRAGGWEEAGRGWCAPGGGRGDGCVRYSASVLCTSPTSVTQLLERKGELTLSSCGGDSRSPGSAQPASASHHAVCRVVCHLGVQRPRRGPSFALPSSLPPAEVSQHHP